MKVGDYIRTKTGIHKIFRINENATVWKYDCDKKPTGEWDSSYEYIKIREDDIIKSSSNIIDLIEEGDYVNGVKITFIRPADICGDEILDYPHIYYGPFGAVIEIPEYEIKSIITKEQMKAMEYKVGE